MTTVATAINLSGILLVSEVSTGMHVTIGLLMQLEEAFAVPEETETTLRSVSCKVSQGLLRVSSRSFEIEEVPSSSPIMSVLRLVFESVVHSALGPREERCASSDACEDMSG